MSLVFTRPWRLFAAALAVLMIASIAIADAKPRFGGSRGDRTPDRPPVTETSRTPMTQPGQSTAPMAAPSAARPGAAMAAPSFGRALMTGLIFGGLFALLAGGALGGLAGVLALLFQVLLIGAIVALAIAFFRRRMQPAPAMAGQPMARTASGLPPVAPAPVAAAPVAAQPLPQVVDEVGIAPDDFNAFERLLGDVLGAYGAGDRARIDELAAADMARSLNENLDENAKKDLVNHIANVKLLQGDLAEAWREHGLDYATVAVRYQMADAMFSTESRRWISGSKTETDLTQVVEHWTFVRPNGSAPGQGWQLSAIGEA
jgi:predicted lipid-binding transport protein (Tim44 family)